MLNTDKELKIILLHSRSGRYVWSQCILVRFWEKGVPLEISPRTTGRGIRQYRKEDGETIGLIYHLVKEKGLTLPGARQRLKDNRSHGSQLRKL